jgi:hypothetical protein
MPPSRRPEAIRDNSDMTDGNALHITPEQAAVFGEPRETMKKSEAQALREKAAQADWLREQLDQALTQQGEGSALAVASDGTLSVHDFQLTPKGLIAPAGISPDAWVDMGRLLAKLEGSLQWLIGDWIVYGESIQWGDIPALAKELGFSDQTLHDYAYVARKIDFSIRIEKLSFAHHRLVAALPREQQIEALEWAAAQDKLTVAAFRKLIHPALPDGKPSEAKTPLAEFEKMLTKNPAKAKPQDRDKARALYIQMQEALTEFGRKWGIE